MTHLEAAERDGSRGTIAAILTVASILRKKKTGKKGIGIDTIMTDFWTIYNHLGKADSAWIKQPK